ncbi:MAG: MarR family transcriptional regulator [Sphingosinicella sp.]|nr:MarR family transcriptional regulator [Sphingosinicella sp.]
MRDGYGEWLPEAHVKTPARGLSTMLLLEEHGPCGIMEISERVKLSHPLIIGLVKTLEHEKLVKVSDDPADGRRRIVKLTAKGRDQVNAIRLASETIAQAYRDLSDEIGVDLLATIERLEAAMRSRSFPDRLREIGVPSVK